MKSQANNRVRWYWNKIKETSKEVAIVSYEVFYQAYTAPHTEVLYFDNALFRVSEIERGFKANLHGYIFSHKAFREINKFKFLLGFVCDEYGLKRIECVVDKDNKGLQKLLKVVGFKNEGIRENGVFLNNRVIDGIGYVFIR